MHASTSKSVTPFWEDWFFQVSGRRPIEEDLARANASMPATVDITATFDYSRFKDAPGLKGAPTA